MYLVFNLGLVITLICIILYIVVYFIIKFLNSYQNKNNITLSDRIKKYENNSLSITHIPSYKPFIVRLDGRSFSKYTKHFKHPEGLPYSPEFKQAMIYTAIDILKEFNASTVYTHSDEITVIFRQQNINKQGFYNLHLFNGRVNKILTILSSYTSVSFNRHVDRLYPNINKNIKPIFDARVIVFDNNYEISNHMIWRSKFDCTRNFISTYAEKYIGKNKLHNLSTKERLNELIKLGYYLDDSNDNFKVDYIMKHGVFIKKNNLYVFRNLVFSNNLYKFLVEYNINDIPNNFYDIICEKSNIEEYIKQTCSDKII